MDRDTLGKLQRFRAESIPAAAIRNQGCPGILTAVRMFCAKLPLGMFVVPTAREFRARLDRATAALMRRCPPRGRHWGTSRKALNLFLRDVTYCHHLRTAYGLGRMETWLEVPVDSDVATGLAEEAEGADLARWKTLKRLTPERHSKYQAVATLVAKRQKPPMHRVHLDLLYWRRKQEVDR